MCCRADLEGLKAERLRIAVERARAIGLGENADVAGVRGQDGEVVAAGRDGELRDGQGDGCLEDLEESSVCHVVHPVLSVSHTLYTLSRSS